MNLQDKVKYQIHDAPNKVTINHLGNFLWNTVTGELAMSAIASDKWDAFAGVNIKDFCQDQLLRYEFSKRTF